LKWGICAGISGFLSVAVDMIYGADEWKKGQKGISLIFYSRAALIGFSTAYYVNPALIASFSLPTMINFSQKIGAKNIEKYLASKQFGKLIASRHFLFIRLFWVATLAFMAQCAINFMRPDKVQSWLSLTPFGTHRNARAAYQSVATMEKALDDIIRQMLDLAPADDDSKVALKSKLEKASKRLDEYIQSPEFLDQIVKQARAGII
jgi:hypothetical protein